MLMYHSLAFPSGPVPPLGTYSSVENTPSPTKEGAPLMTGGSFGCVMTRWVSLQVMSDI